MTVADVMTREVITLAMDDSLESARDLFDRHRIHHLLVLDGKKLIGVVSDRDILRAMSPFVGKMMEREQDTATLRRRVHQIMSRRLVTVTATASLEACARSMLEHRVSCLPVVDDQTHPIGIVTSRDLLQGMIREAESR